MATVTKTIYPSAQAGKTYDRNITSPADFIFTNKPKPSVLQESLQISGKQLICDSYEIRTSNRLENLNMESYLNKRKIELSLKNLFNVFSVEVDIKQITCIWFPILESMSKTKVNISVFYNGASDQKSFTSDRVKVVDAYGIASEQLAVVIHPCNKLYFRNGKLDSLPWTLEVNTDCIADGVDLVVGHLGIQYEYRSRIVYKTTKIVSSQFKNPIVRSSNKFFPYYIPTMIYATGSISRIYEFRDDPRSKLFDTLVLPHVKPGTSLENLWVLRNSLTYQDMEDFTTWIGPCVNKGTTYCTCGDHVHQFFNRVIDLQKSRMYITLSDANRLTREMDEENCNGGLK
ncbi:TPA_asm: P3 [Asclepias syriaca virus 2]|uniref:P3 n=1 Tax=Asclepias syriaca virus 2 TaxID=2793723 RepID=A0A8D9UIT5_9RHAB|nr:P3 [Asclepias syriaca virus 2]DAF42293.1 TPA_asm: P3 [Asclepias syriaca virus 2]